jgi:hypothetical protein
MLPFRSRSPAALRRPAGVGFFSRCKTPCVGQSRRYHTLVRGLTAPEYEVLLLHFSPPDRDATADELQTAGELAEAKRLQLYDEPDGFYSKITPEGIAAMCIYEAVKRFG